MSLCDVRSLFIANVQEPEITAPSNEEPEPFLRTYRSSTTSHGIFSYHSLSWLPNSTSLYPPSRRAQKLYHLEQYYLTPAARVEAPTWSYMLDEMGKG